MKSYIIPSFALAALALTSCGAPSTPTTWDQIENRGYVIVGLDDTFAPMGFRNQAGEIVGFDVDLAKLVFETLDIEVRFQPIDWSAKFLELDSGSIDMVWNGLTITEPRRLETLFSDPYLANRQIVLTKAGSTISTINQLANKIVGVQLGSASQDAVEATQIFALLNELVTFDTFDLALTDLSLDTIDAIVVDEIYGRYVMSQQPGIYKVLEEDFGDELYGIGFRLGNTTIRDTVNDTLFDLITSGEATAISETWFAEDILLRP